MSVELRLKPISISKNGNFDPVKLIMDARYSTGEEVPLAGIEYEGAVETDVGGFYPVTVAFADKPSGERVEQKTVVTVYVDE
ncbi:MULTISPECIES: bacterial Ig-like domain-containing protein [Lacticaseibacillus]|uniref:bacterial Ig-like domain-containing protein n=1 Tax=Lacticaseibacillus TaxID=2759736 RepID=UPI00063DD4AD|nr:MULTISPECIES: bacterial Ig-like domain-containing protein [Lacticaseibacillus]KLI76977.1 hypothetical protein AAW28_00505 [Lacticaseibacillus casei]